MCLNQHARLSGDAGRRERLLSSHRERTSLFHEQRERSAPRLGSHTHAWHAPTLRGSPGGNARDANASRHLTAPPPQLMSLPVICCALARFRNRFTTESKGLRAIKGYLFAHLSLSSTWMPHVPPQTRRDRERLRPRTQTDRQTHTRKLVRLHAQLVHRERAGMLWRNPRQTLPQAGFQLLSITATLTAR